MKYGVWNGTKTWPIVWDITGIKAYQFGATIVQHDTYSKYYAGNCFKGGIFGQLCGWGGAHKFWGDNVSDLNYNEPAGILTSRGSFKRLILLMVASCHLLMFMTKDIELLHCAGGWKGNWWLSLFIPNLTKIQRI